MPGFEATGASHTFSCSGGVTSYPIPFAFQTAAALTAWTHADAAFDEATATQIVRGDDYALSGDMAAGSASLVPTAPIASGYLTVVRNTSLDMTADYTPNDGFPAASHKKELIRLSMVDEELKYHIFALGGRAVRVPQGETVPALPSAALRKGKLLGFASLTGALALLDGENFKGDPGGNAMAIGLFASLAALLIPIGTNAIETTGHTVANIGAARYVADASVDAAYVAAHPRSAAISANGRGFKLYTKEKMVCLDQLGCIGDGTTDDTAALREYGTLVREGGIGFGCARPNAVYVGGAQVAGGGGLNQQGVDVLDFGGADINFDGAWATLKCKGGLRYGGFIGTTPTTASPNYNVAQRANIGKMIRVSGTGYQYIKNLILDGNSAEQLPGGPYGDTGWQCEAFGFWAERWENLRVENVIAHDFLSDGFCIGHPGLDDMDAPKPATFINCWSFRSGRNCFSLVGGNRFSASHCGFMDAGYAPNPLAAGGSIRSSPASCFDIEAEGVGTVIPSADFEYCFFASGLPGSTAIVADSGPSFGHRFSRCQFDGAIWANKPYMLFDHCELNGHFAALYGGTLMDSVRIIGCWGTDRPKFGAPLPATGIFMDTAGYAGRTVIENSRFTLSRTYLNLRGAQIDDVMFTARMGTTSLANKSFLALVDNATSNMSRLIFIDQTGTADGDPYPTGEGLYIQTEPGAGDYGQRIRNCEIIPSAGDWIKWGTWNGAAGGFSGRFDADASQAFSEFKLQRDRNAYNGYARVACLSAAPGSTTGYGAGSQIVHADGAVREPSGWTPVSGVFQPTGIIGAVPANSVAAPTGGSVIDVQARAWIVSVLAELKAANLMKP